VRPPCSIGGDLREVSTRWWSACTETTRWRKPGWRGDPALLNGVCGHLIWRRGRFPGGRYRRGT
jgi:hypothetical protein